LVKLQEKLEARIKQRTARRQLVRYGLLSLNLIILASVVFIIAGSSNASNNSGPAQASVASELASGSNPLDQLSSADIALTVARATNLPEETAVADQSESVTAQIALVPTDNYIAPKPQVVSTVFKSNQDIQTYVTQPGDTVATVAAKFNITSSSLQWSNHNITTLTPGLKLLIPPINGIVYTVQLGDTPNSLAQKYNSNVSQLIAYNDAEINGITPGERIIIPNGQQPSAPTYNYFSAIYGGNGYDFGYCTWYVATQIAVPNNWGNAATWAYYAALSGWNVSETPTVGAIAQTPFAAGGEGHVAIVTAVSPDGSQIQFKDMNGVAGWDRVGYSGWVSASTFVHYITH